MENKKDECKKNPNAVALGRLGGLKGGKARAAALSPERRKEIAIKASKTRWQAWPLNNNLIIFTSHINVI